MLSRCDQKRPALLLAGFLLAAYWVLVRSCGYDHGVVWRYGAYVAVWVWLPGHAWLRWIGGSRISLAQSLALGLPLGFVQEIGWYLGLSVAGLRELHGWGSLLSAGLILVLIGRRQGWRELWPAMPAAGLWPLCALAGAGLLVMVTAAARMYAPAPLLDGQLLQATHHDWVYLVGRAAEIKHRWPLEDPSMAGAPMNYHYFLLVHVASASRITGLEIPLVLLRLVVVALSVALAAQVFTLAREAVRSVWAGVAAVFLLYALGEISWRESTAGGAFQNLFISWLYISPTFFFGMVFMGALLLWVQRLMTAAVPRPVEYAGLLVLAVAGTGAKGTTVVPLAAAAGLWCVWSFWRNGRIPWRMVAAAGLMTAGFLIGYIYVLGQWSGGSMFITPLAFLQVASFWLEHAMPWQETLRAAGLPGWLAAGVAQSACAVIIIVGGRGILLLGLVRLIQSQTEAEREISVWLALVAGMCLLSGLSLYLDSHGESYLFLPMRLPLAVLTAAAVAVYWRTWLKRHADLAPARQTYLRWAGVLLGTVMALKLGVSGMLTTAEALALALLLALLLAPPRGQAGEALRGPGFGRFVWRLSPLLVLALFAVVQVHSFLLGNRSGFRLWQVQAAAGRDAEMTALHAGLEWLRDNTPVDAVIFANIFTPEAAAGRPLVDRTTVDKYFYYSAIAERRLFVEGPAYLRDQAKAGERMKFMAGLGLQSGGPSDIAGEGWPHRYLLIDHQSHAPLPDMTRSPPVFRNHRVAIYELDAASTGQQ